MTPYFYWYDVWTQSHLLNPDHSDALTTHPVTLSGFSYKSMQWHKTQLSDMEAAGIDVVLPVYWGDPSQLTETGDSHWSYAGIPPLVAAREELLKEGRSPPRIGCFMTRLPLSAMPGMNTWISPPLGASHGITNQSEITFPSSLPNIGPRSITAPSFLRGYPPGPRPTIKPMFQRPNEDSEKISGAPLFISLKRGHGI
jgi:hypothetical protein